MSLYQRNISPAHVLKLIGETTPAAHTHDATDITVGTLADARLSSNVALKNVSNIFTATQAVEAASGGIFGLGKTNEGTDGKNWGWWVNNNILRAFAWNDAKNSTTNYMSVTRTGMTIDSIDFAATALRFNGVALPRLNVSNTFTNPLQTITGADARWVLADGAVTGVIGAHAGTPMVYFGSNTAHPVVLRTNAVARLTIAAGGAVTVADTLAAGGSITGTAAVGLSSLGNTVGYATLLTGGTGAPGHLSVYSPDGTRRAYIGFTDSSNRVFLDAQNGWGWHMRATNNAHIVLTTSGSGHLLKGGGYTDAADDSAAASAGVPVNGHYRTGSTVKIRVS